MQTSYNMYQGEGFPGLIYDTMFTDKMSFSAEDGDIRFGVPVMPGTDPARQVRVATTGAAAIGVSVRTLAVEQPATGEPGYKVTETVSVLKRGRIWVRTNDAVLADTPANIVIANGTFTDAAVEAGIEAPEKFSARFITGTSAAGLAVIEVNPK